jgi:DNA (cytosine-5)-methyltransferase 1
MKRKTGTTTMLTAVELCAGAGGQALGLERAGFSHLALAEIDSHCCRTLKANRPEWNVIQTDISHFSLRIKRPIDLLAAGLPCPPFSVAGKQLGKNDERNLFPAALRIVDELRPKAVLIENVRGLMEAVFDDYRTKIARSMKKLGYRTDWRILNASDFGVSQLRPRVVFVALREGFMDRFVWPEVKQEKPITVGNRLYDLMAAQGWHGVDAWRQRANEIAPTVVGGSLKHGGPDLGPTRARRAWASLGVDGLGIADEPPKRDFIGMPKLTVRMVARIQGFPDSWDILGRKTAAYRQVGNAFPPPVAHAVGQAVYNCLTSASTLAATG